MKKILAFVLSVLFCLSFTGCIRGGGGDIDKMLKEIIAGR